MKPKPKSKPTVRPTVVERPLWVLTKTNMPRLVAMATRGRAPIVLDDVRYFAREGDKKWKPIEEIHMEKY